MKQLTLENLERAIYLLSKEKPAGFDILLASRDYMLGRSNRLPAQDPREILIRLGMEW